jgi:hypothetical protein
MIAGFACVKNHHMENIDEVDYNNAQAKPALIDRTRQSLVRTAVVMKKQQKDLKLYQTL